MNTIKCVGCLHDCINVSNDMIPSCYGSFWHMPRLHVARDQATTGSGIFLHSSWQLYMKQTSLNNISINIIISVLTGFNLSLLTGP